jgi:hypothetical protein
LRINSVGDVVGGRAVSRHPRVRLHELRGIIELPGLKPTSGGLARDINDQALS